MPPSNRQASWACARGKVHCALSTAPGGYTAASGAPSVSCTDVAAATVSSLLAGRADPSAPNGRGKTPLEVAQRLGNDAIVKLFEAHEEAEDANYRDS